MHWRINALDLGTKGRSKRLMTKTNAKKGRSGVFGGADQIHRHAGILRRSRAGRNNDAFQIAGNHLIGRHRVIAQNFDFGAKIRQEMPQIPGKAVIIIDQNEQDRHPFADKLVMDEFILLSYRLLADLPSLL